MCARKNVCVHALLVWRRLDALVEAALRTKHVTALTKPLVALTYVVGPLDIEKKLASRILAPQW